MKTVDELRRLEVEIAGGLLGQAEIEWGGADVIISKELRVAGGGFYPEPRSVVTSHSLELSWLFESLRDAFYAESRLDGCSKIEFFGCLANAANRCLNRDPATGVNLLCAAVLHEAFAILDEMDEGSFQCLGIAFGNEIADDYVDEAMRSGFLGTEETLAFFASHGVEVGGE